MTAKEAAHVMFENFPRYNNGNPTGATVCEALMMAIWALMEQGRFED